jgi:hypothetical protein
MEKKQIKNHETTKKTAAVKTAVIVALMMVINAANIGAFVGIGNAGIDEGVKIKLTTEIERVYGVINIPVKIVNKLIKKSKIDVRESCQKIVSGIIYSVIKAANGGEEERESIKSIYSKGSNISKKAINIPEAAESESAEMKNSWRYKEEKGYKIDLILKLIGEVLPRGIDGEGMKSIKNIGEARPAGIINAAGFFHL